MLKFEIRNSIVDEEIVSEDDLELVSNFGIDTVKMREIEMPKKNKIKINWRNTQTKRKRKWKHGWKKKNWRNANAIENEGTWTWFCPWKITLFEKWFTSSEVTTHFDKVRQSHSYWRI